MNINNMFESLKNKMQNTMNNTGSNSVHFFKMEKDHTYKFRLILNKKDPSNSIVEYLHHGWRSIIDNKYRDVLCPKTWNERCPICEYRIKLWRGTPTEDDKNTARMIKAMNKYLVNIYVEESTSNPEDVGKIKILRMSPKIYKKIQDATYGEDMSVYGSRIYDLSENGCSMKIKVTAQLLGKDKINNYDNSKFLPPSKIDNMTEDKIEECYENCFDLTTFVSKHPSPSVLKDMLNVHLLGNEVATVDDEKETEIILNNKSSKIDLSDNLPGLSDVSVDDEDAIDKMVSNKPSKSTTKSTKNVKVNSLIDSLDDELMNLIDDDK